VNRVSDWQTIDVCVDGLVAWLRFNRPDRHNAVSSEMVTEVCAALRDLSTDPEVTVVVLTGRGATFCPGADLQHAALHGGDVRLPGPEDYRSAQLLHEMPQVTLAAINGGCAGAGFAWASACDLRVASDSARFSTSFLEVGLAGELGLAWTLQHHLGGAVARDLCLLPRKLDAHEALAARFVSRVFPAASFDRDVQALVAELAARQPEALRQMKANFLEAERLPLQEFIKAEAQRHLAAFSGGSGAQARARLAEQGKRIRDSGSQ